jgi:membrane-anchored protein YejM (alkaline phosphatase superfamily)
MSATWLRLKSDSSTLRDMDWSQFDIPTRVAVVAAVVALLGLVIPPISLASAVAAVGFSAWAWQRSRSRGESNRAARLVCLGGLAFIALVVAGNAIYSANN